MATEIRIAQLKAHLSEQLRWVQRGHEVIVKDRETPIARIVPVGAGSTGRASKLPTRTFQEVAALLGPKARKKARLRPGVLELALRESKMDWLDKWLGSKPTSTLR